MVKITPPLPPYDNMTIFTVEHLHHAGAWITDTRTNKKRNAGSPEICSNNFSYNILKLIHPFVVEVETPAEQVMVHRYAVHPSSRTNHNVLRPRQICIDFQVPRKVRSPWLVAPAEQGTPQVATPETSARKRRRWSPETVLIAPQIFVPSKAGWTTPQMSAGGCLVLCPEGPS